MNSLEFLTPGRSFLCRLGVAVWMVLGLAAWPASGQPEEKAGVIPPPSADADVASLYDDFIHFARLGRFDAAEAYVDRLLAHPQMDPAALLDVAERNRLSVETLMVLIAQSSISSKAQQILDLIHRGEYERRREPARIKQNIENLAGPPQAEHNAIERLRESGEYAIPWMIDVLTRRESEVLRPRIVRVLPQIGQPAVNPLVIALGLDSAEVQQTVARALGQVGYAQAIPYLRKLLTRPGIPEEVRKAATEAIAAIEQRGGRRTVESSAAGFVDLAQQHYEEHGSVRADPRLTEANLWLIRDGVLTALPVPTEIYGPAMAMRCCEEALLLEPNRTEAIALWLAANIRRETRLGMSPESAEPETNARKDPSAPEDFPRSIYFTRAAGPLYAHLVLERAVRDRDAAVALGAIAALRVTAGESSLVGTEDHKQPLVQALTFPDRLVRIKAALALVGALPKSAFAGSEEVSRVLASALRLTAQPQYVVVDPDEGNLNRVLELLRGQGAAALGETDFSKAMERARLEFEAVCGVFVATNVAAPGLERALRQLREESALAMTPIVLLTRPEQASIAEQVTRDGVGIAAVDARAEGSELSAAIDKASAGLGQSRLDAELALRLALETADVLRRVAEDGRTVIRWEATEPALIAALGGENEELRVKVASVLSYLPSSMAQRALARAALAGGASESARVAFFGALAESAKKNANRLDAALVDEVVKVAGDDPNLTLRTAASQALGALNLTTNQASQIIRKYYQG